jgi:hypothetical protein
MWAAHRPGEEGYRRRRRPAVLAVAFVVPARAQVFGDLIEAAYDLHRTLVYRQLRWPLPGNPAEEQATGAALTSYLRRGSDATGPAFTPPPQ